MLTDPEVAVAVAVAAAAMAGCAAADRLPLVLAWTLACLFFSSDLANRLSQISHVKGFSPVWVRICVVR